MFVHFMHTMAANVSGMQAVWQAECKSYVSEHQLSTREALATMLYLSKEAADLPGWGTTGQRRASPLASWLQLWSCTFADTIILDNICRFALFP